MSSNCGTPALRKYLDTMMSVASCENPSGTSASGISKTTEPSGFVIRLDRVVHCVVANGSVPSVVNRRVIFIEIDLPSLFN